MCLLTPAGAARAPAPTQGKLSASPLLLTLHRLPAIGPELEVPVQPVNIPGQVLEFCELECFLPRILCPAHWR